MKRFLALFLILSCCLCATASAGGLSGLGGNGAGGLSGLTQPEAAPSGVLPDPEGILNTKGTVLAEDYVFSADYVCTAYTYPMPGDMDRFLATYADAAKAAGYTMTEETVDGQPGWRFALSDEEYALMVPHFDGKLLLLVKNGMEFGQALPEGYYLQVWRNGRKLFQENPECEETRGDFGSSIKALSVKCFFSRSEITLFTLKFPNYAQAGDEFYVTSHKGNDKLYFYTTEETFLVNYDNKDNALEGSGDYLRIKITSTYPNKKDDGTVIEGVFDGSFNRGKTVYSDGSFRVLLQNEND